MIQCPWNTTKNYILHGDDDQVSRPGKISQTTAKINTAKVKYSVYFALFLNMRKRYCSFVPLQSDHLSLFTLWNLNFCWVSDGQKPISKEIYFLVGMIELIEVKYNGIFRGFMDQLQVTIICLKI